MLRFNEASYAHSSTNHFPLFSHLTQYPIRNSKSFHPSRHTTIRTTHDFLLAIAIHTYKTNKTHLACSRASLISTSLTPFRTAPLTCVPSSVHLPNAVSMTRFRRLRSRRLRPGRVQIVPQALSCYFISNRYLLFSGSQNHNTMLKRKMKFEIAIYYRKIVAMG